MTRPSLDDVRAAYPHLGLAVYAYEPGGPVTLEIHAAGQVFAFEAATEAEAVVTALPELEPQPPTDVFG